MRMRKPTRQAANSTRMGNQFAKRLEEGLLINRDEQKARGTRKNPKHLVVPNALRKFFKKEV